MDVPTLVGPYGILLSLPIWTTAMILFFSTIGVMHVGCVFFEGAPYQVSPSGEFCNALILGVVLLAGGILQSRSVVIPEWLQGNTNHLVILAVCEFVGIRVSYGTAERGPAQLMDKYHNVIIAPAIAYLAITLLPVIYINGTTIEKTATIGAMLIWLTLTVFEDKINRMNLRC